MTVTIHPSAPQGTIKAIASKSAAHRLLICAAFAEGETTVRCEELNDDIVATVRCLNALGADIRRDDPCFFVKPVSALSKNALLPCGESGSTLRFLLPVVAALGADASFFMQGRLPERPLSPLREEMERHGVTLSPQGENPLSCKGQLTISDFSLAGNVSSQFLSGLLFALAVSGKGGRLRLLGALESAPYVQMTIDTLSLFGVCVTADEDGFTVAAGKLRSPASVPVEGDWSGAAFPLCMGAVGKHPVTVSGLSLSSAQGDKAILSLLRRFGATVTESADSVTVSPAPLHGIDVDASQIPDLVPVLAATAAVARGTTVIHHAERLRLKESDRLQTTCAMLNALGAHVTETEDGLRIEGVPALSGGSVSAFGDHRIAMSAATAAVAANAPVVIDGAECAAKSYPRFWDDIAALGVSLRQD